jgi:hypothetical protein
MPRSFRPAPRTLAALGAVSLAALAFTLPAPAADPTGPASQPAKTTTTAPGAKATAGKTGKAKSTQRVAKGTMPEKPKTTPEHIEVQHILIGFAREVPGKMQKESTVPGKPITRTMEEARKLAESILERARAGEPFDSLVVQYTEDSPPGIYGMSGIGVTPAQGEYPRNQMVPAFGDVGFNISVGNIDVAPYDPVKSPYGWHIIKRLM